MKVVDQHKHSETVHCSTADLQGLMAYLNAPNAAALEGRKLEGNDLEKDLNAARDWAFNMSEDDKKIDTLAKGIMTFKSFSSEVVLKQIATSSAYTVPGVSTKTLTPNSTRG